MKTPRRIRLPASGKQSNTGGGGAAGGCHPPPRLREEPRPPADAPTRTKNDSLEPCACDISHWRSSQRRSPVGRSRAPRFLLRPRPPRMRSTEPSTEGRRSQQRCTQVVQQRRPASSLPLRPRLPRTRSTLPRQPKLRQRVTITSRPRQPPSRRRRRAKEQVLLRPLPRLPRHRWSRLQQLPTPPLPWAAPGCRCFASA